MIPGSYKKRQKVTLKKILKKCFDFSINGKWRTMGNFILSDGCNLFNQNKFYINRVKLHCPLCQYSDFSFIHLSNENEISWNSACPKCDSRSRHRGLIFVYKQFFKNSRKSKILHFAPEEVLKIEIKKMRNIHYLTTDIEMTNVDFPNEDIQYLSFNNSSFDFILINHVLEHVSDDEKAISELSRILKPKGIVIITIPGNWSRKHTKEFKKINYNGHYRDYGLDAKIMFQKYFSFVDQVNLFKYKGRKHAIKKNEPAFICTK